MNSLPNWFINHPSTKAIMAEQEKDTKEKRTMARKEVDRIQQEAKAIIPELQSAVIDAETVLSFWEDQKAELLRNLGTAAGKLTAERFRLSREEQQATAILFETCDPAIDAAIDFFREKIDLLRLPETTKRSRFLGEKNILNGKQEVYLKTNGAAVLEAINYCREAFEELEGMKLQVECDQARIDALKCGIPSIDTFVENEYYALVSPE